MDNTFAMLIIEYEKMFFSSAQVSETVMHFDLLENVPDVADLIFRQLMPTLKFGFEVVHRHRQVAPLHNGCLKSGPSHPKNIDMWCDELSHLL